MAGTVNTYQVPSSDAGRSMRARPLASSVPVGPATPPMSARPLPPAVSGQPVICQSKPAGLSSGSASRPMSAVRVGISVPLVVGARGLFGGSVVVAWHGDGDVEAEGVDGCLAAQCELHHVPGEYPRHAFHRDA